MCSSDLNSGTTAGVFIPAELVLYGPGGPEVGALGYGVPVDDAEYDLPAVAQADPTETSRFADDYADDYDDDVDYAAVATPRPEHHNGHADIPISLLPQRNPGASGISDIPSAPTGPVDQRDEPSRPDESWPADPIPVADGPPRWHLPVESSERPVPMDTSSFFAAKAQAASQPPPANGSGQSERGTVDPSRSDAIPAAETGGSIFEKMLSEWLIDDPNELAKSADLDWQTVWDHGWSAAAAAEEAPVSERTDDGLPVRRPGARLVPGAADQGADAVDEWDDGRNSAADTGPIPILRDPEAVRSSIGSHFGGVHAGRAHARDGARREWETEHE